MRTVQDIAEAKAFGHHITVEEAETLERFNNGAKPLVSKRFDASKPPTLEQRKQGWSDLGD